MQKNSKLHLYSAIFLVLLATVASSATCPQNCLFCLLDNQCITCQSSFFLTTNSSCIPKSIDNCRVYESPGKCAVCEPTFRVSDNVCVKDLSGCLLRDRNRVCQECGFGTTRHINGTCLGVLNCALPQRNCVKCRNGYRLLNNVCVHQGSDCQTIQPNGLCSSCRTGFILNGFECVSRASNAVANGAINLVQKCSLYSRTQRKCLQCEQGYQLMNGVCVSEGQIYNNKLSLTENRILQNYSKPFIPTASQFLKFSQVHFSLSNQRDDVLDPNQRKQAKLVFQGVGTQPGQGGSGSGSNNNNGGNNNNNGGNNGSNNNSDSNNNNNNNGCLIQAKDTFGCLVCIDGYFSFNGLCRKKTPVCLKFNTDTNRCQSCHETFGLVNGQCVDLNCDSYLEDQCSNCKQGFSLNEQGYCIDINCANRVQGICTQCVSGYQVDQSTKVCFKAIPNCLVYTNSKASCLQCSSNFTLSNGICNRLQDEKCLIYNPRNPLQCVRCRDQFGLMQGTCIDLYCRVFENPTKCTLCREGYTLHPLSYCFDQNCVLYTNGTCINCANNYKLENGFCVKNLIGCTRVNPATQTCNNCANDYRLVDGRCIYSDKERCIRYSGTLCIACKIEYALVNGTCVDLLCERQTLFNNYYACQQCKPGFNLTRDGLCYDENCFRSANGQCTWCADNYVIGPNGLCVKSTLGCMSWNESLNRCNFCHSTYTLNAKGVCTLPSQNTNASNNTIDGNNNNNNIGGSTATNNGNNNSGAGNNNNSGVNTNPNSNQQNPSTNPNRTVTPSINENNSTLIGNNTIRPNDPNCREYDASSSCLRCEGRFFIRNGRCVAVPQVCRGFDMRSGNCTACQTGFALYTEQSPHQECFKRIDSDPNCNRRNTNFFCIRCRTGYFIKAGFCYLADTLCRTFDIYGGQCLSCYEGYTLEGEKCIPLTQQPKCKTYDFQNVCIECENRYFVDSVGACKQISQFCVTYQMRGGACLNCQLGYWPANGVCIKVKDPVPNCKVTNQLGDCVECNNRYYLESSSMTCKLVNPLCNDYNTSTGACLNCSSGYKLRADLGLCVLQNSDELCTGFTETGQCSRCHIDYILNQRLECVKVNPLCSVYNKQTGECQKCVEPYYMSFKECLLKFRKDVLDMNCQVGDMYNFCLKCKPGFYINTGNCLKANDQCKTFNLNTGACETCYDGFVVRNRDCVLLSGISNEDDLCELRSGSLCIKCKDRYYLSYEGPLPSCKRVNSLCQNYNEYNGDCYTCIDGYVFNNGNCIQPSSNNNNANRTYIEVPQIFCREYDLPAQVCRTCYNGYFYSKSEAVCKMASSDCRTFSPTNGLCTSCFEKYYLVNGTCLPTSTSSIRQPQDRLDGITTQTVNQLYCQTYNATSGRCITCNTGYQLLATGACSLISANLNLDPYCTSVNQKKCVNCLPGYFVDTKTGLCTLQSLWCETYNMIGGVCSKCKVGSIMQDGMCIKPALGVDPYCSFYDGAYCFGCVTGYKLVNFVCQKA